MSEFFYNRDSNISGATPISSLSFAPEYGSKVSFSCRANKYLTHNGYSNTIPMSANNLNAKFSLNFKLSEVEAQQLVDYVERQRGVGMIAFSDPSSFYKTISGTCINYAVNHHNRNYYEVGVTLDVDEIPSLFNWSGMSFVNHPTQSWVVSQSYDKYKTIYHPVNTSKLDNYYYCSGEGTHTSTNANSPSGASSVWTQDFFFEPDYEMQNDVQLAVSKNEFRNSFVQNVSTRKNTSVLQLQYQFKNIPTEEAKSIMQFLENKAGYRRFVIRPNSVYNRPKIFTAPQWEHSWDFANSHSISVTLEEDPLGVMPTNS